MLATKQPTTAHIQLRPGVKPTPPMHHRIRIIADTVISREVSRDAANQPKYKGELVYKGSVLDVTIPQWGMLYHSLKAVIVDDETPLYTAPAPVDPLADRPKMFLDCVESGLNLLTDIAAALNTSKLAASQIAKQLIASGLVALNDRGVYVRTAKKA